jgi:hypothetical protein
MASAAPSLRREEPTDGNVAEEATSAMPAPIDEQVARGSAQCASPVVSTEPSPVRMPVAFMVRPEIPDEQSPGTQDVGEDSIPVIPVIGTDIGQIASVSQTTECRGRLPDERAVDTDRGQATSAPLTLSKIQTSPEPKAPEPMDLSPDGPDTLTLNESAPSQVEDTVDGAISEQVSAAYPQVVELALAESVNGSQNRPAPGSSTTLDALQPTSATTSELQSPLLGTDSERALTGPPITIIPHSISSKTSLSQPLPAHIDSNNSQKAPEEHAVPTPAVQVPTSISAAAIALPSPTISPTAEPYFEYTIHQTTSSALSSTTTTELSAQPFTTLDSANAQTEKLFQNTRQQYELLGMRCRSTTSKVLDNGLSVHEATFINIEDPSSTLSFKLWVERAEVSVYANHTPPHTSASPLISKTLYALRLWRLKDKATDSDPDSGSEAEDDDADDDEDKERGVEEKEQVRTYHPFPQVCTELHTSLESANRAAKRVQIELSHERDPKSMQAQWQLQNLRELNEKLADLRREVGHAEGETGGLSLFEFEEGRRRGCWRSVFRGAGVAGFDFELLVMSVGVSGPRNI